MMVRSGALPKALLHSPPGVARFTQLALFDRRSFSVPLAIFMLLSTAFSLWGCRSAELTSPEPTTLRLGGSTSLVESLQDLALAYQHSHPHVLIEIRGGGTDAGLRALDAQEIDLAAVSWEPSGASPAQGHNALPVARDGIALIVHPSNPITSVTLLQAKAIYQGELLNWSALGGRDLEPVVISREDGSGTRAAFETQVLGNDRVTLNALVMPGNQAVVDYVARHPAAIGYVSTGVISKGVRALAVEDVPPSPIAIATGEYRLTRIMYLYRRPGAPPAAQSFLDFALSPAGQAIVARRLVPVRG